MQPVPVIQRYRGHLCEWEPLSKCRQMRFPMLEKFYNINSTSSHNEGGTDINHFVVQPCEPFSKLTRSCHIYSLQASVCKHMQEGNVNHCDHTVFTQWIGRLSGSRGEWHSFLNRSMGKKIQIGKTLRDFRLQWFLHTVTCHILEITTEDSSEIDCEWKQSPQKVERDVVCTKDR